MLQKDNQVLFFVKQAGGIAVNTVDNNMITWIFAGVSLLLLIFIVLMISVFGKKIRRSETRAAADFATGGLNRAGFAEAAEKCLKEKHTSYSVVVMELKNYFSIRRTFGSKKGDLVLAHLHRVMSAGLSKNEPAARLDGGMFCFLLKNQHADEIEARLTRIYESANIFNSKRSAPYSLDLCFGIYIPQGTSTLADMQEKATEMLTRRGEDSRFRFYKHIEEESPDYKRELVSCLDNSLQAGDFVVYMQPKVRLGDNRIVSAEALVRWRHPKRGTITPDMFIPVLEEYQMVHLVDRYLFNTVCKKLSAWKREGKKPCPVSVNLSCESLCINDFAGIYARMCHAHSIETGLIEFELSEKFFCFDLQTQRKVIEDIHSYGFRCSLDNIGKHTIPLHLLRELDIDAIKLDSSLFTHENNSRRNRFTIEAILKLASQMQLQTVAEGIDNASQIQYLKQAACDIVQGFYYFKPMPIDEFQRIAYLDGDLRFVEEDETREEKQASLPQHTSNSSNIVMFTLLTSEDRVEFSAPFSPALEGQQSVTNAISLFQHSELIHENDRRDFFHLLERCQKDSGWVENTLRFYTAVGHYEWMEVRMHKESIQAAGETVISGTLVNITGWKNEVNRWKEKANRDALTGLYNREFFEQTASDTLKKDTVTSAAMVFIDIDDFKQVNDTLGHVIGDDVICWVAKRILGAFRHTDVVARYGGDEFVVFANGIAQADLEERLTQLCDVFKYPYRNGSIEYIVSGSIGAALFPDDGSAYRELLDHADSALYTAKRQGKNRYVLYEPGMESEEN